MHRCTAHHLWPSAELKGGHLLCQCAPCARPAGWAHPAAAPPSLPPDPPPAHNWVPGQNWAWEIATAKRAGPQLPRATSCTGPGLLCDCSDVSKLQQHSTKWQSRAAASMYDHRQLDLRHCARRTTESREACAAACSWATGLGQAGRKPSTLLSRGSWRYGACCSQAAICLQLLLCSAASWGTCMQLHMMRHAAM